jgi:flagellar protein FliO/FliZ
MSFALQALVIFILVFGIGALGLWLVRRFGSERLPGAARGRQPRLAVLDQAAVDSRRRLVLVRRDNVEHLILIGGPTDVVIEPHIVRAAAAPREAAPRPLPAGEALPRALPLGEGSMWPLQPESAPRAEPVLPRPEPAGRPEPMLPRSEPPVRLQRLAPLPVQAPPEQGQRETPETEPPPPPPARERRVRQETRQETRQEARAEPRHDPLSGLAEELGRAAATAAAIEPAARQPLRREPRARPTPASPGAAASGDGRFGSSADQNLAEMAQRLEAALLRPSRGEDARPAPPPKVEPKVEPKVDVKSEAQAEAEPTATGEDGKEAAAPGVEPPLPGASPEPRATRGEGKPAQQKSLYDSLEQEMARLLGRPAGKA